MRFAFLILAVLLNFHSSSQQITGRVFNSKKALANIKVQNNTQKKQTYTNDEGYFKIEANVGDTLTMSSVFYQTLKIPVKTLFFKSTIVFELQETDNTLSEVNIVSNPKEKVFDKNTFEKQINKQIKSDILLNPDEYSYKQEHLGADVVNTNMDFIGIIGKIGKLFKGKKRNKAKTKNEKPSPPITYEQIKALFKNSKIFTPNLLSNDLKIAPKYHKLFFEFCAAQNLSSTLLQTKHEMELLEFFITKSKAFLTALQPNNLKRKP